MGATACYRTFLISNLTPGPRLGFPRLDFSYMELHLGFFFLFLKKKKIKQK